MRKRFLRSYNEKCRFYCDHIEELALQIFVNATEHAKVYYRKQTMETEMVQVER